MSRGVSLHFSHQCRYSLPVHFVAAESVLVIGVYNTFGGYIGKLLGATIVDYNVIVHIRIFGEPHKYLPAALSAAIFIINNERGDTDYGRMYYTAGFKNQDDLRN